MEVLGFVGVVLEFNNVIVMCKFIFFSKKVVNFVVKSKILWYWSFVFGENLNIKG